MSRMRILFVAYGGGHIASLIPLIKALKPQKNIEIFTFALTTAQNSLEKEGIDFFDYTNLPFFTSEYVLKRGKELLSTLDTQKINSEESIAYLGWNIIELEETYGVNEASKMYAEKGRNCFFPIRLMKKILQFYEIDFLISTNSPRSERAALEAASHLDVPSLCIIDGFAKYESEWISQPGFSKKVCVFSESVKKNLIKLGRPEEDILVTGNPAFDAFYVKFPKKKIKQFREKLGLCVNQKLILYASNPESDFHIFDGRIGDVALPEKVLETLVEYIGEKEGYSLIYRPHPSQQLQKFDKAILSERIILDEGFDLLTLLHASDVVVTLASTVGVQAQIVGKPLICMNSSVYADDMYYEDFGYVRRVNSLEELKEALPLQERSNCKQQFRLAKHHTATRKVLQVLSLFQLNSA